MLVVLALASLAGFSLVADLFLTYDANGYGSGALAGFSRASTGLLTQALLVLGLLVFVLATGRLGGRGALVALLGFAIIGPWLAGASPLHDEPSVRTVCCDGVRSFQPFAGTLVGIGCFVIVVPITLVVRWISRHRRHPA